MQSEKLRAASVTLMVFFTKSYYLIFRVSSMNLHNWRTAALALMGIVQTFETKSTSAPSNQLTAGTPRQRVGISDEGADKPEKFDSRGFYLSPKSGRKDGPPTSE